MTASSNTASTGNARKSSEDDLVKPSAPVVPMVSPSDKAAAEAKAAAEEKAEEKAAAAAAAEAKYAEKLAWMAEKEKREKAKAEAEVRYAEKLARKADQEKLAKLKELESRDEEDSVSRGKDIKGKVTVAPAVASRRLRGRHYGVLLSFVLLVLGPPAATGWYMWERAADRYVSTVGFSVRKEESSSPLELLGGIANIGGSSSSSDTNILSRFIQSQEMVAIIDADLDLRTMWSKGNPELDPIFTYHAPGTIEDLTDYWGRMVSVFNDNNGLIDIEVQAFTPEDAQAIAQMIYDESTLMINELSAVAQADATRFSREELDQAVERLKQAREAVTLFRNRTQIVDPTASVQSQMGILSSLERQLAETLIDLDILRQTTAENDPRIVAAERRVEVIEARMQQERDKLGLGSNAQTGSGSEGDAFADLLGEYERLMVDQQFAEQAYIGALASFDSAVAQTRRQSRYLAAHVSPTLAERSDHPKRLNTVIYTIFFSFLIWSILVLSAYALKDRR